MISGNFKDPFKKVFDYNASVVGNGSCRQAVITYQQ